MFHVVCRDEPTYDRKRLLRKRIRYECSPLYLWESRQLWLVMDVVQGQAIAAYCGYGARNVICLLSWMWLEMSWLLVMQSRYMKDRQRYMLSVHVVQEHLVCSIFCYLVGVEFCAEEFRVPLFCISHVHFLVLCESNLRRNLLWGDSFCRRHCIAETGPSLYNTTN